MTAPDPGNVQQPTKGDRWASFLIIAVVSHCIGLGGFPTIIVPPGLSQQLVQIELGAAVLCLPFICSLFLLFFYRTKLERIISYVSLAVSFLYVPAATRLIVDLLQGP